MPDWDEDSPQLDTNATRVVERIRVDALARVKPSLALVKSWHTDTMAGLIADDPAYVGSFRGEPGVVGYEVEIGGVLGVLSADVASEVSKFEPRLQRETAALDKKYPTPASLDEPGLADVINLAAWTHSEWVRIHPFANGNGRTARYLANFIFVRYGVGFVVRIRPRPRGGYPMASAEAMKGNWRPTAALFANMIVDAASASALAAIPTTRARKKR